MKLVWVIACCFFIHIKSQKIYWKESLKLTWDNFKGKNKKLSDSSFVAYANCGWEYKAITSSNPKARVKIIIKTIFYEDKSWKNSERINDFVLLHEQKHYDVAELFVRKLRKEIAEKIITTRDYHLYFQNIHERISRAYKNFQNTYDKDTQHGTNKEKQIEYNAIISAELKKLKNFQLN